MPPTHHRSMHGFLGQGSLSRTPAPFRTLSPPRHAVGLRCDNPTDPSDKGEVDNASPRLACSPNRHRPLSHSACLASRARRMPLAARCSSDRVPVRRAVPTARSAPWSARLFKENPTSCPIPPPCADPRAPSCFEGALRADAVDSCSPEHRRAAAGALPMVS